MTRQEFTKKFNTQYSWLLRNKPELLDKLLPKVRNAEKSKLEILKFIKINGRKPSRCSKDALEKKMGGRMASYVSPGEPMYDPEFRAQVEALIPTRDVDREVSKREIIEFIDTNGRRPSQHSKDALEKKMRGKMCNYVSPGNLMYDPEFRAQVEALIPTASIEVSKLEILKFIETNGRKPSRCSKDALEKKMRGKMGTYMSPSHRMYDPEFRAQVEALIPTRNYTGAKIKCHQNNKIYKTLTEAAKNLGLHAPNISAVLKNRCKHTKGYTFEYI